MVPQVRVRLLDADLGGMVPRKIQDGISGIAGCTGRVARPYASFRPPRVPRPSFAWAGLFMGERSPDTPGAGITRGCSSVTDRLLLEANWVGQFSGYQDGRWRIAGCIGRVARPYASFRPPRVSRPSSAWPGVLIGERSPDTPGAGMTRGCLSITDKPNTVGANS
jgi:hypothetical protein